MWNKRVQLADDDDDVTLNCDDDTGKEDTATKTIVTIKSFICMNMNMEWWMTNNEDDSDNKQPSSEWSTQYQQ